jgi:ribosomal protein S18 acetylase RimI-like enzyme
MSTTASVHVRRRQVLLLLVGWVSFLPGASLAAWIGSTSCLEGVGWSTTSRSCRAPAAAALYPVLPSWAHDFGSSSSLALAVSRSSSSSTTTTTPGDGSVTVENIRLDECGDDTASIQQAAAFMVDSFWLGSRRQWSTSVPSSSSSSLTANEYDDAVLPAVSDTVRSSLLYDQTQDFLDKFGERLGERRLEAGIILAKKEDDSNNKNIEEILGMVCLTETLLEQPTNNGENTVRIWQAPEAEQLLKETVAALSPSQRRQYKNASAQELMAQELSLLPQTMSSIVCLSNLAVLPAARRQGVARQLCEACEQVARDTGGYSELHLLVEADNVAARHLYETKLGYQVRYTLPQETALRVNLDESNGGFIETLVDTLVLVKKL